MARSHRLRRTVVAAFVAPIVALPVAAPAVAAAATDRAAPADPRGYGGIPWYDYAKLGAYGDYGEQTTPYAAPGGPGLPQTATSTDTQPATAAESTGVVLVNTSIDYGSAAAAGTGLVLTADGIVVTNHHVVEGATEIEVTDPSTQRTYEATVLGYDSGHDIAVLQLDGASGLATVTTDRAAATDGEEVTSVGNADGRGSLVAADGTVTDPNTAITVSDDDGSQARLRDLIEVDADVVSGDSGGALLDEDGDVIGMNVAASAGGADVSGYAIPIDTVLDIAAQIMAGQGSGDVEIGQDAALGIQVDTSDSTRVVGVVDGGGAADAGITAGSTITRVDGTFVSSVDDITKVLGEHQPGDQVSVAWTDPAGASHAATVTLGRAPVA